MAGYIIIEIIKKNRLNFLKWNAKNKVFFHNKLKK